MMDHPLPYPPGSKPALILEAATRLFLQHGFGAVSMDAVARESGVSKATLYAHFDSKNQLFATLVRQECAGMITEISASELENLSAADGLTLIARRFTSLLMTPKVVAGYRIVVAEAARFPDLAQTFYQSGPAVAIARVAGYLTHLNQAGLLDVPDPPTAAEQFLGMLKSHLHLRLLLGMQTAPEPAELERLISAAVTLFTRGYAR